MNSLTRHVNAILTRIVDDPSARQLVALAGPPGTGKSTVAEALAQAIRQRGQKVTIVPMDGFHLDNRVLEPRGLLPRKGAPETFDAGGFLSLVRRIRAGEEVIAPVFDRARDIAIAGAQVVPAGPGVILFEGNYLLFDESPWRDLRPLWDLAIWLDTPIEELRRRLVERWLTHGLDAEQARIRAEGNDLANARRINAARLTPDMVIGG
ncbi:fructokinase [Albidovulum inexpectatum]|uniref:Fructokinase n=1 Tax=Albidovulum inexpectatum TaxID=196587 RepID=A0A2S5JDH6_9RHOB|nr:nucleoside triphosphate hydrolase [Albidovulum inexpectatum]PPB79481.1 fructokinase [Albidovulum inexpectatum]